jgi:hypothetical protein
MFKWDYCRVDEVPDSPDGPYVGVAYYRPFILGEVHRAKAPPVEFEIVDAGESTDPRADQASAVLMFTTYEVIERLGAEGWEAFHIEKIGAERSWFFKRPYTYEPADEE